MNDNGINHGPGNINPYGTRKMTPTPAATGGDLTSEQRRLKASFFSAGVRAANDLTAHIARCEPCRTPGVICGTAEDIRRRQTDAERAAREIQ